MQYGGIGFISGPSVSDDVDLIMNNQHNHKQSHRSSNHRRSNPPGTEQDPDEAHNNRHPALSSSCSSMRPRPVAAGTSGAVPITVDEAIDRLGMGLFQYQIVLACGTYYVHTIFFSSSSLVFQDVALCNFFLQYQSIFLMTWLVVLYIYLCIYLAYLVLSFLLKLL